MLELWNHMPIYIILLHVLTLMIVLFAERKRPVSTISWVFTLLFLPVLGVLLYIFLGTARYVNVKRRFGKKLIFDKEYHQIIQRQLEHVQRHGTELCGDSSTPYPDMIVMNMRTSDSLYSDDNLLTLLPSAREKYDRMFADIRAAKKSVHLMYYIFRNDHIGNELIDLLAQKASEGVEIRLMYDSFGNLKTPAKTFRRLTEAGGQVIRFLPRPLLNLLRVNYRNHRKIVVIDGKIGYLGGINIGDEYLGLDKTKTPWRDTHLRVEGSSVATLQLRFLLDWQYLKNEKMSEKEAAAKYFSVHNGAGSSAMQIVSSGPDSPAQQIKYGFVKMINSAKKTLYLQTPYLIPDDTILDGLKIAVESGVDVRVMIPGIPDKKFVYYATLSYVEELLQAGIRVYAYNGFLHSKMMVADSSIATLGTTNMDLRGFRLAFEVNAFIYDSSFAQQCSEMFLADIAACRELDIKTFSKRSVWGKMKESVFRLLSPLM